jgi:hypothetical protein
MKTMTQMAQLFISLLIGFSLTACAPKKSQKNAPTVQQVSWCEAEKNEYENRTRQLHVENVKRVNIERRFQRVLRYDCQNNLISNRIETVKSPRGLIRLKPSSTRSKNMKHVELLNIDTCEKNQAYLENGPRALIQHLTPVTGRSDGEIKLNADLAPSLLTYRLNRGMNRIYYTYTDNRDRKSYGIYNVFVEYNERTLPGILQVRNQTSCSR